MLWPTYLWRVTTPSLLGSLKAMAKSHHYLQQVLRPAPLFCIMTPVTEYLKGLLSLQSPLMTKSMRLLILTLAFSLL